MELYRFSDGYIGWEDVLQQLAVGGGEIEDGQTIIPINAMSAFSPPSAGQMTLPTSYQDDLVPVIAANWSST